MQEAILVSRVRIPAEPPNYFRQEIAMSIYLSHSEQSEIASNRAALDEYIAALPCELEDTPEEVVWQFVEGGYLAEDMIIELAEEAGFELAEEMRVAA